MNITEKQISVMQKFAIGKRIEQKALKSGTEWREVDNPSWNWVKNDYRERIEYTSDKKDPVRIKDFSNYEIGVLTINHFGRPILSRNVYSMIKPGKKMIFKIFKEVLSYQDNISENYDNTIDKKIEAEALINASNFLKKLSVGIRSPSDKDRASDIHKILQELLNYKGIM